MIQLRQVSRYVYDVFAGTGFDQWTRVRKQHWGLVHIAGLRLGKADYKALQELIAKHPQGSIEPIAV